MGHKTTEPLKITCRLKDGCVATTDGIIMFDAILYHGWYAKYEPEVLSGEKESDNSYYSGLPLTQNRYAGGFYYSASKGMFKSAGVEIEYINRRPDFFGADKMEFLSDQKGQISDAVGEFRAHRIPLVIHTIEDGKIIFYANGTKSKIEDLLEYIPAVGKKPSSGFGLVDEWIVESCGRDYSIIGANGELMRPMPVDACDERLNYPMMQFGVKPPYWKPVNFDLCYVPLEVTA